VRADLEIVRAGPEGFLISHPASAGDRSLGSEERFLLHLMDGSRSAEAILRAYGERFGRSLPPRQLADFTEQLRAAGVLEGALEVERPADPAQRGAPSWAPRACDLGVVLFGWLLHPLWTVPVGILAAVAVLGWVARFDEYLAELWSLLAPLSLSQFLGKLLAALLSISFVRSAALGIACRSLKGSLLSFRIEWHRGVLPHFVCVPLLPLERMTAHARGLLCWVRPWTHLALASAALIGWLMTPRSSSLGSLCLLFSLPLLVGLGFQCIPFAPLDAYRILSARYGIHRLYERARAETRAWLTLRPAPEALADRERTWFRLFGLGVLAYRSASLLLFGVGGSWFLSRRFGGPGAAVALLAILLWYSGPLRRALAGGLLGRRPAGAAR
jgi:hypothetical protein